MIKKFRLENGLTQQDFAEMLGVTQSALSRWENGSRGTDHLIAILSKNAGNKIIKKLLKKILS